jgi:hypothetical protein
MLWLALMMPQMPVSSSLLTAESAAVIGFDDATDAVRRSPKGRSSPQIKEDSIQVVTAYRNLPWRIRFGAYLTSSKILDPSRVYSELSLRWLLQALSEQSTVFGGIFSLFPVSNKYSGGPLLLSPCRSPD